MRGLSVVCVVGPTASGKSALAELVATRLGSSVVSVDAMQVYRGMDVGTAKTPVAERRRPLLMVDVVDPDEDYSVQRFQTDARDCVDALLAEGLTPVLCGGTGLYLNAVIDEMAFPVGEKDGGVRERYERIAADRGADALHALLAERDPESAALIHPNNVRRVVRALEMSDEGVSYARHHEGLHERAAHYPARIWGLSWPREDLYARIDARVDQMVEAGLVEEVRALAVRGLTTDVTAGQAIGYKEILEVLSGRIELEEAVELVKRRTRRYAKRQLSWFRHDGRVRWLEMGEVSLEEACERIVSDLERREG
ncbi:tRNA (adenosine(37)-N6)-dimethylallyltransferase MiaA [Olsenella sp. DSM 107455]|uniref:tRNA dimethylallyltransferase n=1 Tax=Thermophilibacter gallinarum TaxID=2779357 RepID=A0ABR9QUD6_9ACTN|nr:tRNA (adenosine(37)-N6)-dimethylallyltransferase MiaA [Thermophilibacter gallinarum]